MVREQEIRPGEVQVDVPDRIDAARRIHTPWTSRMECPRQGRHDGLQDVPSYALLEILYWLDHSRRDLVLQSPKSDGTTRGVFSIRSPVRPNPIGTSIVKFERIEGNTIYVRGLDCLDGTPLLDIKPDRTLFSPLAAAQPGDFQIGDATETRAR